MPWRATSTAPQRADNEYDFYHWSAILRSVSGFEIYRKVYRNVIQPEKVAELLIVRPDMPRSLAACVNEVMMNLKLVANEQSAETCDGPAACARTWSSAGSTRSFPPACMPT